MRSFFLHQSVGGDLEDGAQALGFKFEYADSHATSLAAGLNGGLFASSNGNPADKVAEFRTMALANRNGLGVAIMKFGYADIVTDTCVLVRMRSVWPRLSSTRSTVRSCNNLSVNNVYG